MKKILVLILIVAVALLAGCAGKQSAEKAPASKEQTVKKQQTLEPNEFNALRIELDRFRNDPAFHEAGFRDKTEYRDWWVDVRRSADMAQSEAEQDYYRTLVILGMFYQRNQGRDDNYTKILHDKLDSLEEQMREEAQQQ